MIAFALALVSQNLDFRSPHGVLSDAYQDCVRAEAKRQVASQARPDEGADAAMRSCRSQRKALLDYKRLAVTLSLAQSDDLLRSEIKQEIEKARHAKD
jgi:hypothetical protein